MGWTVGDFQEQVEMMTSHSGLSDKVEGWLNRVIMEVAGKAHWRRQITTQSVAPNVNASTAVTANWLYDTTMTASNPMAIYGANYRSVTFSTAASTNIVEQALIQQSPKDFYDYQNGLAVTYGVGDPERYCQPKWTSYSNGGNYYMLPQVAVYPQYLSATSAHLELKYLSAPEKLSGTDDNNWITDKYPKMVLNGVLRYAFLYLSDTASYNIAKANYVNGVADMVRNEEAVLASNPYRRGVMPSEVMRGGA